MNNLSITNSLEGTPLTISATSMPSLDGMGTGAIRSSVFEINNSSSNVNFISHVWSCCSDLYFAVKAYGPKGRQGVSCRNKTQMIIGRESPEGELFLGKTKQVSAIEADHKNEVRCWGVPFLVFISLNRIRHIMKHPSLHLTAHE